MAEGPLHFRTSSAFALNLGLGFAALVLPGVFLWSRARSYAAVLDAAGALTRAGQQYRWADLRRVSTREFRPHRRGWYIGQRVVELDFTTGHVLLEEVALDGPFQAVWDGFHARLKDAEAWLQDGMKHIELSWQADHQSERTGDLENAVAAFECAISISAEHAAAWAQNGYALSRLGRYEDAAAALAEAIRLNPDDAGLLLERGHALARLERLDEALDCYDRALARKPEDADSWFLKAETLEALGRDAEALVAWDRYLRRHEDRRLSFLIGLDSGLRAELRRAGVLARLGRRDDALTAYRAAFEGADRLEGPMAPSVFHDALRNVEEARAAYAERLESRRDDPNTWRRAGQTFLAAKMSQASLEAYDTMIRLVPNEPDAWYGKAEALVQAGRVSEAIAAYEQALRIRPGYQPAAIRLRAVADPMHLQE